LSLRAVEGLQGERPVSLLTPRRHLHLLLPCLALAVAGCSSTELFASAGTLTGSSFTRPVSLNVSLVQCARPAVKIGTTCHVDVAFEPGGRSFVRGFHFTGGAPVCEAAGHRLVVQQLSGEEDPSGYLQATVTTIDEKGELAVLMLHGSPAGWRDTDSSCHTAPDD
jgi:hypothetical protein